MPALFRERQAMTTTPRYTTNLSKAQGMVPETLELLELWQPGMSVSELKARVRSMGALGKATQVRVDDVVGRAFAQRFLIEKGKPAEWLRFLLLRNTPRALLRQLTLVYTARANRVLHDFIREEFWVKYSSKSGEVTKQDALEFVGRAIRRGEIERRWSEHTMDRVARDLLGTLADFELIANNRFGCRQIRPMLILPETVLFLAYDLHLSGVEDDALLRHPDWGLFGRGPADVVSLLEKASTHGHLFVQHAGSFVRVEWKYKSMEEMLDALTH